MKFTKQQVFHLDLFLHKDIIFENSAAGLEGQRCAVYYIREAGAHARRSVGWNGWELKNQWECSLECCTHTRAHTRAYTDKNRKMKIPDAAS